LACRAFVDFTNGFPVQYWSRDRTATAAMFVAIYTGKVIKQRASRGTAKRALLKQGRWQRMVLAASAAPVVQPVEAALRRFHKA
jgi:hypothetical protein